jgi:hypothetical protein
LCQLALGNSECLAAQRLRQAATALRSLPARKSRCSGKRFPGVGR